ncbi:hypothetical protein BGW38_007812, partial [Lunasporangiospora selenospora]
VQSVRNSAESADCLTVLLTGRNAPVFGERLLRMVSAKGLAFDIIAAKPTTVAAIGDPAQHSPPEKYLKVHTFSTKLDFLYNILLEYPAVKSMHLWDDRPCQIAAFRQAGEEWLRNGMLREFDITTIKEPLIYMDPRLEIKLVLDMVSANNRQVEIEAHGGPFLVAGVGPLPRRRPDLEHLRLWDPVETYVPRKRSRIQVGKVVPYTGVKFSPAVQSFLRGLTHRGGESEGMKIEPPSGLGGKDLQRWVQPDDLHVALWSGKATAEYLEAVGGLGAPVFVELERIGEHKGRIWAIKVKDMEEDLLGTADGTEQLMIVAPDGQTFTSRGSFLAAWSCCSHSLNREFGTRSGLVQHSQDILVDVSTVRANNEPQPMEALNFARIGKMKPQRKDTPTYITLGYDRFNGAHATDARNITTWQSLVVANAQGESVPTRIILVGTLAEKSLIGQLRSATTTTTTTSATYTMNGTSDPDVCIDSLIQNLTYERRISAKLLRELTRNVQEEMERLSVENRITNEERIATIAQEVCNRSEALRVCSA